MGKSNDRDKLKEELTKRTQESYDRKDKMGSGKGYFKPDSDGNVLPTWKAKPTKEDPHMLDIIPFKAGKKFPQVDEKHPISKGDTVYVLESFVHTNVGPGKEMIVCPAKNYSLPCPICEYVEKRLSKGATWDDIKNIAAKRRCAYNVWVHDSKKEERKGVQIWEASHRFSEKGIQPQAKNPKTGGSIPFAHPSKDIGRMLSFEVDDDTYFTIHGHKLNQRDEDIPEEIMEGAFRLDKYLNLLDYEEILEKFKSAEDDEDEEDDDDEKPKRKSREDDDDEEDEEDEDEKPRRKKKAKDDDDEEDDEPIKKKKKRRSKDEDDEDEDDEPPKKKKKKSKDDDEDEEDEEDEDEPIKKKKKKRSRDDDDDDDEDVPF